MQEKRLYSKEETRQLKEKFWTKFGQYLAVVPSAEGEQVNWVNYKTGVKHLYFKMHATNKYAQVAITIAHPDQGIRNLMFSQFKALKVVLEDTLQEEWDWIEDDSDEYGKVTAVIRITKYGVSIFNQNDWPELISFFKPRIIALDEFWDTANYSFDIFK